MTESGRSRGAVLIAEDEPLIAFYLEDIVVRSGYSVAGSFVSSETATAALALARPLAAILDVLLRDGPCFDLVRRLRTEGIPVILVSAAVGLPAELRDLPLLTKPIDPDELVRWLDALSPRPESAAR